jgi:hypothetical protein
MSVSPVQSGSTGIDRQTPEKKATSAPSKASAISDDAPKAESASTQKSPLPPLIPEHEVKVQWDTPADQVMVYRVLDKQSGDLVLQVPSAEVLSGMHQTQELLHRIASRGKAPASAATGKENDQETDHGNKL